MTGRPDDKQSESGEDQSPAEGHCNRRAMLKRVATTAASSLAAGSLLPIVPAHGRCNHQTQPPRTAENDIREIAYTRNSALKQRAINDYRASTSQWGGRMSAPAENLFLTSLGSTHPQIDIVIIGSGYGGSICAARLAPRLRPGARICIIERGREWVPGTFPDTFHGLSHNGRNQLLGLQPRTVLNPLGLFNAMQSEDFSVLTGSGLGGTSLINASIALKPDPDVFACGPWPMALQDPFALEPYFERAAFELSLSRTPIDQTPKVRAARLAAARLSPRPGFFDLSPVSVMYDHRHLDANSRNPQGMIQRPCIKCGDCTIGCNVGSKNTLVMNYLPLARQCGTEMYTQFEVRWIEREGCHYRIHLVYFDDRECELVRRYTSVTARAVILAAGSPGSAEILLRSRERGLPLSEALGCRWSANGDMIGFAVNTEEETNIGGFGAYPPPCPPVGPTVQTSMYWGHRPNWQDRFLVQEASIPSAVTTLFKVLMRDIPLQNTMLMLAMGHDGAAGRIELDETGATIRWPGARRSQYRLRIWDEFEMVARAYGGRYRRLRAFGDNIASVHPLGGCPMDDHPATGVTNDLGQVYDARFTNVSGAHTSAVHPGLYVADGSIIPTSLGVNPFLTISALAERIADWIPADPAVADLFIR